jgi:hypothetical protein
MAEPAQYSLSMALGGRALVSMLIVLMVVVPIGQLMSSPSWTVMHQLSAKVGRASSARVPAVTGAPLPPHDVALAVGRVDPPDAFGPLPGFTLDLFVPPRA